MQRMKVISDSVDTLDLFSEDQDDFASTIFADAHQLNFDSDGRIILPEDLKTHAHLDDSVAFVGRGTTFQLWNPDAFAKHQQTARQRVHDKRATIKLKTDESKA
jgi:MraZ protein